LTQRREQADHVQQDVGANGENDAGKHSRKQGEEAAAELPPRVSLMHVSSLLEADS